MGPERCAGAPSSQLGQGRGARVRAAAEPSGRLSTQSREPRRGPARVQRSDGEGGLGLGPRALTAGRFARQSVDASVRRTVGASRTRAPRAVRSAGRNRGVEGRARGGSGPLPLPPPPPPGRGLVRAWMRGGGKQPGAAHSEQRRSRIGGTTRSLSTSTPSLNPSSPPPPSPYPPLAIQAEL